MCAICARLLAGVVVEVWVSPDDEAAVADKALADSAARSVVVRPAEQRHPLVFGVAAAGSA